MPRAPHPSYRHSRHLFAIVLAQSLGETAYPAAFVVDGSGKVRFAKVSRTHGGRAAAAEVLEALDKAAPGEGR